jgi:hypothetical protein
VEFYLVQVALLEVKVHKVSQYAMNDRLNIADRKL